MTGVLLLAERYEIAEIIGRGGMGDVYAGRDRRLQRDVAIKVMRPGAVGVADAEARFEDEARVAARLQHPNVVAVYDTGTTGDGRPFIVMERLPGVTLADQMRAGPLSQDAVRVVADDVLAAMAAAHAAGILHRDIKPGNILMTEDGRAKIADFGVAREADTDSLLVDPTTTNALSGTPAYLAPERLAGQPATAASDIWALGVVLYEALAGRKPFDGPTPIAVAMAVRDGDNPPLEEVAPDTDPTLTAAVNRAMNGDPAQRFQTAREMRAAVAGVPADVDATVVDLPVVDRTIVAGPAPLAAAPWWRRLSPRAAAIALGAAAAILLLVGIGVAAGRSSDDHTPVTPARPANAEVTTTAAPTTTLTTTAPVQNVQPVVPPQVRRRARGKKGKG
jgi:serine/threonine protein kinase